VTNILKEASKLVFVLMAIGAVILTFLGKIESKTFVFLATIVFAAYYESKSPGLENKNQSSKINIISNEVPTDEK